ncbi:MAG: LysM peptidoglycan-binding domain-containing protein [Gammaproteobacteria bacterium]|nr:LysM peptidoglycan-binding domain-containing protein [Gammaproteobacteria bacterium]
MVHRSKLTRRFTSTPGKPAIGVLSALVLFALCSGAAANASSDDISGQPDLIMDSPTKTANDANEVVLSQRVNEILSEYSFLPAIGEFNRCLVNDQWRTPAVSPWQRIASSASIQRPVDENIDQELQILLNDKYWTERKLKNADPYLHHVIERLKARNLPVELALLPIIESNYDPAARSPNNAVGLWQFVPATARALGLTINQWLDERKSIERSTEAALDYLEFLHADLGSWPLAIAAYNAGPSRLRHRIKKHGQDDFAIWDLHLPEETHRYVAKFFALSELIARADELDVALPAADEKTDFVRIETGTRIGLDAAARLANLPTDQIERLNHELITRGTPPEGPHEIVIPANAVSTFTTNLHTAIENAAPLFVPARYHLVEAGDSLGTIANRYNTSVDDLRRLNNIDGSHIRSGQKILVAQQDEAMPSSGKGKTPAYQVREGDTLSQIASMYGVQRSVLANSNNIDDDNLLRVGKILIIPARYLPAGKSMIRYSVKAGDTLSEIAYRFKVSLKKIKDLNPLLANARKIQPGQKVLIPTSGL